ncbi:MAG TPA: hypothetical protein VM537_10605 [Anaerolineae bacterium]|nr:hypothetical protein [Anaerolineae bacterium]
MKAQWPLNRPNTLIAVGIAIAVIAAIPDWVGLLEDHDYDVPWLIPSLELVQRARWVIVALVACAVAVHLVYKFWRRRDEVRPATEARYVSTLAWLARPVRADLWARLRADVAHDVRALKTDALSVLQFALAALDPCAPGPCYVPAVRVFFDDVTSRSWARRLEQACSELVRSGMASSYHRDPRGVEICLRRGIREADETGELSRLVGEELKKRAVCPPLP